jgi:hypothetical protein
MLTGWCTRARGKREGGVRALMLESWPSGALASFFFLYKKELFCVFWFKYAD